jgi:hypothetical protein
MPTIASRCKALWNTLSKGQPISPLAITIPPDHVRHDGPGWPGELFAPERHYFQVRVNELHLAANRQWFTVYDPMVFIVSEFDYEGKRVEVPYIVGPGLMEKYGIKTPTGMVFEDIRVAGLHPYRGGRLTLSVVLCQVKRAQYLREILQIAESAASALDFSTALGIYLKVADVVLDGVEALTGSANTQPLAGIRREIDPDAGDPLRPAFFLLADVAPQQTDSARLFVRDGRLVEGDDVDRATPFRGASYVLFSITQTPTRGDVASLPFYPLWQAVEKEAAQSGDENWKSAKANMVSLMLSMLQSPDLTDTHADQLATEYEERMKALHARALRQATMPIGRGSEPTRLDRVRERAVSVLDL